MGILDKGEKTQVLRLRSSIQTSLKFLHWNISLYSNLASTYQIGLRSSLSWSYMSITLSMIIWVDENVYGWPQRVFWSVASSCWSLCVESRQGCWSWSSLWAHMEILLALVSKALVLNSPCSRAPIQSSFPTPHAQESLPGLCKMSVSWQFWKESRKKQEKIKRSFKTIRDNEVNHT